jgi:glycosyltransferase involved in cell wall biosynthesis
MNDGWVWIVSPRISVLLPVHNGEAFLTVAVDSILKQTFLDFELIVIDDGSTDTSCEIIAGIKDSRVRLIQNEQNLGLIAALNKGMSLANGRYLARMDADDISLPRRLERQVEFLQARPDVGICGTWSKTIGHETKTWETHFPERHWDIVAHMLFNTAISHPTAMFDVHKIRSSGLRYSRAATHAEDYNLWVDASDHFRLANVPEVLFHYRFHAKQTSNVSAATQSQTADVVRRKLLKKLGVGFSDVEFRVHSKFASYSWERDRSFYADVNSWLRKLMGGAKPNEAAGKSAIRQECTRRLHELRGFVFGEASSWQLLKQKVKNWIE